MSSQYYRYKAFENKPAECEACDSTEALEVHHKDKNRCNNDLDNLIILCEECHTTVHYGWAKKGTFLRKLIINAGISVPDPVFKQAAIEAERRDISRGAVVEDWKRKAERYDELEVQR